ncbi:MAG: tetratricopeptide repeat protein [Bacteroidetes bacterium]|nr:tetratricopeptide repeat protein [Bacteroidota bacterium]
MYKFYFYIILTCFLGIVSCSSVRTNTSAKKAPPQKSLTLKKTDTKIQEQIKPVTKPKSRFTDTTKVVIKPNIRTTHVSINSQLDTAIVNFEKASEEQDVEKLDEACLEIKSFGETFAEGDSLKFEAMFYKSECLILKQDFEEAEKVLSDIAKDKLVPNSVLEKSLVRLGQVYCALDRKKDAQSMFSKFRKKFPDSIYKEIANCEAIRQ